jgi:hypothetical protein
VVGSFAALAAVAAAMFVIGAAMNVIPLTIFWRSRDLYQRKGEKRCQPRMARR